MNLRVVSTELGEESHQLLDALKLLKPFIDETSTQRIYDYLNGLSRAREIVLKYEEANVIQKEETK